MTDIHAAEVLARIGKKLTSLRKKKGYTSHETFAFDFDLPRVQYWRLERGKSNFTIKTLHRILSIHNVSVEEFFSSLNDVEESDGQKFNSN